MKGYKERQMSACEVDVPVMHRCDLATGLLNYREHLECVCVFMEYLTLSVQYKHAGLCAFSIQYIVSLMIVLVVRTNIEYIALCAFYSYA